eukprot:scaffold3266_cov123-Cylindrotheca_fusiformis.AAC.2
MMEVYRNKNAVPLRHAFSFPSRGPSTGRGQTGCRSPQVEQQSSCGNITTTRLSNPNKCLNYRTHRRGTKT